MATRPQNLQHPTFSRRTIIQAGAIGLMGLGMNHVSALRSMAASASTSADDRARRAPRVKAKSVIYIFLSGGLSQHDSFDLKPESSKYGGPFKPIATKTPGVHICEHLPMLAACSDKWALVRSMTHRFNEHSQGHMVMLSGRSDLPPAFDLNKPKPSDWPSIAAIAGQVRPAMNNLPPAVVLPEKLVHRTGRVIPGQFAGLMGERRDPWFVQAVPFNSTTYGAYPQYTFHHERGAEPQNSPRFHAPHLSLPQGISNDRFGRRLDILRSVNQQQRQLEDAASVRQFGRYRQMAIALLADPKTWQAFDVEHADPKLLDRYGRNSFGWSLLMARQLVEAGVSLVQVNLGNNESWDTHVNAFHNLEHFLFPPTDRAVSALLDDLAERGLLDETLVVMAGEFGRTPRIFSIGKDKPPGRDHWGAVQTVFFAGGGVKGGQVIGSSDDMGAYPATDRQTPENMAATIYNALGIPPTLNWYEPLGRPHPIYQGDPIPSLT